MQWCSISYRRCRVFQRRSLLASDVITNERKIETKVLANDSDIVVLGGLVKEDIQDSTQGVPLLSSIPLLGRLFRNDVVTVTKSNLLGVYPAYDHS